MLEYKKEDEAKLIQNLILGSETWNSEFLLYFANLSISHCHSPECWQSLLFFHCFLP